MLLLKHAADGSAGHAPPHEPLDQGAAICIERALLAGDVATRLRAVQEALAIDPNLASWTLRTAEIRSGRTVNRIDEAAQWLAGHLVTELAAALTCDTAAAPPDDVAWRLPALVKKLFECEGQLVDFQARLEREKIDSMKELAYGASHEINNPLANIAARAQTLLQDERDPQRRQKLIAIHRQAMRAHEMIADLMLFARPPKLIPASFNLHGLVRQVVSQLNALAQEDNVQVDFEADEKPIEIVADETQLGVAVHALVKNAIEAVSDGGCVTVSLQTITTGDKSWAKIMVRDDGPGISDEVRRHMFDPFFSGREAGRGLGFGLSKCWRIVTDHGGQVVVQRPTRGGAEISILLPLPVTTASEQPQTS